MIRTYALPPSLRGDVHYNLMKRRFRRFMEGDIANAFKAVRFTRRCISWCALQTADGTLSLQLAGTLGLKCLPAFYTQRSYYFFTQLLSSTTVARHFWSEWSIACTRFEAEAARLNVTEPRLLVRRYRASLA